MPVTGKSAPEAGAPEIAFAYTIDSEAYPYDWPDDSEADSDMERLGEIFPPWGSKESVNRAGNALRSNLSLPPEHAATLENWRASHNRVLNTFQAILRNRTRGKGIVVAQRLKRRKTIIDKLWREPKMQLARMDDVAGCRLIFSDVKELYEFREKFLEAHFAHRRKNGLGKYDYIKAPKPLGYRGVHDIYEYNVSSKEGARFKGLMLELQYRTKTQHAWATAVEVVTQMTKHEPKFNRGGDDQIEFFRLASEILARTQEGLTSCYPFLSDRVLVQNFISLEVKVALIGFLQGLNALHEYTEAGHVVMHFRSNGQLQLHPFEKVSAATRFLFHLEEENPNDNIVLVQADTFEQMRSAYRNYFSDATEFLVAMESGCKALAPVMV